MSPGSKLRVLLSFLLVLSITFPSHPSEVFAAKKKSKRYSVLARSALLVDSNRMKVLYAKNASGKILPASTAKVMTALIVLEKLSLEKIVTIDETAPNAPPSKIFIKPGERYRVADLLYATLINSANDGSIALAKEVAGSEWKFVQLMNQRARELGARNTQFANASGLPTARGTQFTTVHDMALIFRAALKNPFLKRAIQLKYKNIYSQDGRKIFLKNHNKMLFTTWGRGIFGKTGYTRAARSCFIGFVEKNNKILIVGVFGSNRRWLDIKHIIRNYAR